MAKAPTVVTNTISTERGKEIAEKFRHVKDGDLMVMLGLKEMLGEVADMFDPLPVIETPPAGEP